MNFTDKVVLITGGTGGLGTAVVDAFRASGATVILTWHGREPDASPGVVPLQCDVTRTESVTRAVTEALVKTGHIDALVNLVGGYAASKVIDTTDEVWHRMLDVNLTSAFILSRAVLPHMKGRGSGRILHVASRAVENPFPGAAAYIVSKSGLAALTRTLAVELAGSGVTANAVLPTIIDTPANRQSMPEAVRSRWVSPENLALLLLFLASDDAREINGALLPVG